MRMAYLQYFLDVAEYRSIAKAARANFISPQGMSRVIRELEQEFGCSLVERFPNSLRLSTTGEALLPQIQKIVDEYQVLRKDIDRINQEEALSKSTKLCLCAERNVRFFIPAETLEAAQGMRGIVASTELENTMIYEAVRSLTEREGEDEPKIGAIATFGAERAGAFDGLNDFLKSGEFVYKPYLRTPTIVVVAPASPLASKSAVSREDELSVPVAASNEGIQVLLETILGEDVADVREVEDFGQRMDMVKAGEAITFMPSTATLMPDWNRGELFAVPLETPCTVEFGFIGRERFLSSVAYESLRGGLDDFYKPRATAGDFTLFADEAYSRR